MKYEIRYIVDGEEFTEVVDVDTAAEAAETVKQHHEHPGDTFELIQVHLMEDLEEADEHEHRAPESAS
jgi:macrodomain Ter protein organizer (MatP/YcbG family)